MALASTRVPPLSSATNHRRSPLLAAALTCLVSNCAGPGADEQPERLELDLAGLDGGMEVVGAQRPASGAIQPPILNAAAAPADTPLAVSDLGSASTTAHGSAFPAPKPATTGGRAGAALAMGKLGGAPGIAATRIATTVYERPNTKGVKLGYLRLGGIVSRSPQAVSGRGCKGKWYQVEPRGFVCTDDATIELDSDLVRATQVRPALDKALPYRYGFVRATAPQYLKVPSLAEQRKSEFKLDEHLKWYSSNYHEVQRALLGANDIPLDERGYAHVGLEHAAGFRLSSQLSTTELLGGSSAQGLVPFWLAGARKIRNVSAFQVPEYAIFADRVRRKTGLSFVDAFVAEDEGVTRRFAVTVDMRLIPATKVKPDTGSPYHGLEITSATPLPFALVIKRDSHTWNLLKGKDEVRADRTVPRRAVVPLSGQVRFKGGRRFYQTARSSMHWLQQSDVGVVLPPQEWPEEADSGGKWIDVSLKQQTLVLYQGRVPKYATLVSTGRDRLGDPKKSLATPQGQFRIQSKHIAAAMDSEENSSVSGGRKSARKVMLSGDAAATRARLSASVKAGKTLKGQDKQRWSNIQKGRHPEYGVTMRRGTGNYELRDVPWIQYFAAGYALHGAYWHDVFGLPRSHGCINLAPIDARAVFMWTDPPVPPGWHGLNVSGADVGTLVYVHE